MTANVRPILLCVSGLTPQIITETVYALITEADEAGHTQPPTRIEVITTTEGRRRLRLSLFSASGGHGHFDRLCRDYGIDRESIEFDETCIHVIRDDAGNELSDITDEAQNAAAADVINRRIRMLCRASDAPVHVSLAGGRKTMGFYAGYALSLYGRPQDRLLHVLVNSPFESHPDFFYPPPQPATLVLANGKDYASTADARIKLANIPIVRLRNGLDNTLLEGDLNFSEAVTRAQQVLDEPELVIDVGQGLAWLQGRVIKLSRSQFIWLTWFAQRVKRGEPAVAFDESAGEELLEVINWLEGEGPSRLKDAIEAGLQEFNEGRKANYFDRSRTRLNTALRRRSGLHPSVVEHYQVHSWGRRPRTLYGLRLRPEQIRIEGEP